MSGFGKPDTQGLDGDCPDSFFKKVTSDKLVFDRGCLIIYAVAGLPFMRKGGINVPILSPLQVFFTCK